MLPTTPTPAAQLLNLSGRVALVTGGARGIGYGIALRLALAGAAVMIADLGDAAAQEAARAIGASGGRAAAVHADVSQPNDAREMVRRAAESFGRLDILVNNAGIYPFAAALHATEAHWDQVLDVNLKGAFFAAQAAAQQMVAEAHGGRIVNIASVDALRPTGNLAAYDASKAGLVALTRALALELAQYAILVNAILPGEILTPGAEAAGADLTQPGGVPVEDLRSPSFLARIPLGRLGEPDDVAKVVLFLVSGLADYITGSAIVVDGGYTLS